MDDEILDHYLEACGGKPLAFEGCPPGQLGIMDFHDEKLLNDAGYAGVRARVRNVVVKTSVADLLGEGAEISINSVAFVARERFAIEDGAFTLIELAGVPS